MLQDSPAFSGYSVNDAAAAQHFYADTLGLEVEQTDMGLSLKIKNRTPIFIYQKDDHAPATYTVLNFPVVNIDEAVKSLGEKGVEFLQYDDLTDEHGIARGLSVQRGPDIAWFTDPAGNILSILQSE